MAFSIIPSGYWEGDFGSWSTFAIRVGTPSVVVHVLPATSQNTIWTVSPLGCAASDPGDCPNRRGLTFSPYNSTSFNYNGHRDFYDSGGSFQLPFESEAAASTSSANYSGGAIVGLDTVGLGIDATEFPQLSNQTLACYGSKNPLVGQLGLRADNASIANFSSSESHMSVLGYLNSTALQSASWAYTAGSYRNNYFGSLTFGGYDAARGNVNNVMRATLASSSIRDLVVVVSDIEIGTNSLANLPQQQQWFIDSMLPDIWLPAQICDQFQSAFGLTYDNNSGLYLVNDSQHNALLNSAPSVTFTLSAVGAPGTNTTRITMPYSSFDHNVSWPVADSHDETTSLWYFPLRRATSPTEYYLGRAFLQNAYLSVNHDNLEFNLSQTIFPQPDSIVNLVTISDHEPRQNGNDGGGGGGGLSTGAIAGIAVGVVVVALLAAAAVGVFFFNKKRKQRRSRQGTVAPTLRSTSIDGTTINEEMMQQHEHYKPPVEISGEEQDQFKPELQGSAVKVRAELYGSSVRRISDQSRMSGAVSPLDDRSRMRHSRQLSDSSYGVPSPRSEATSPPLGPLDRPSPPIFAGPFELHASSRDTPRTLQSRTPEPGEQAALLGSGSHRSALTSHPPGPLHQAQPSQSSEISQIAGLDQQEPRPLESNELPHTVPSANERTTLPGPDHSAAQESHPSGPAQPPEILPLADAPPPADSRPPEASITSDEARAHEQTSS